MLHVVGLSHLDYRHSHRDRINIKKSEFFFEFSSPNDYIVCMEEKMTIEQMRQRSAEARRAAKELQRRLPRIKNTEERKLLSQQMNALFNEASLLRNEAQFRHGMEESIEREFLSIQANLEDD